jgi:glycosyltransferase involved in cell wall biosynthesis
VGYAEHRAGHACPLQTVLSYLVNVHTSNSLASSQGVSVVIPCYNYAQFLPAAIDSVLNQTAGPCEVIVVDDGSTDDTRSVAAGYGERIRYLYKANAGLPAARNTGIRSATQPLVAFLDADDRWEPGFLRRVLEVFASAPLAYGLVAAKATRVDPQGRSTPRVHRDQALHGALTCRDILLRTCFSPSAVVTRREVFERCGLFDETLTSSEDRDMWIRIGACFPLFLIPEALVLVCDHPGSMSKNADRMKRNSRRVIRKAFDQALVPRWQVPFWLRVLAFNRFQCAWMYRDQGRHARALAEMSASLATWPWFGDPSQLNEPVLFRVRALRRFLWEALRGSAGASHA